MRSPGLFFAGLAALAIGVLGLFAITPMAAGSMMAGRSGFGPGPGMMGGATGMLSMPGMAGMMGGPVAAGTTPIGLDLARAAARDNVARSGAQNLDVGEVMEFAANYYAQVVERDTGIHALELLIDKYTGVVFPEMGPQMVWNTKYGMMGSAGMMGWQRLTGEAGAAMPVGPERAAELARQYLAAQGLQLEVGEPDRFYGYYTLHTLRGGQIDGMLSVNGYSGEVWYHAWHGPFIRMQ